MNQLRYILKRTLSTLTAKYNVEHLKDRSLIRVSGSDVLDYLQGLMTNDVNHLKCGIGSIYTMFLNTKGRVLFDSIVYRTPIENTFLIECDTQGIEAFQKHLKMYRVRRKIDILSLEHEFQVYTVFNPYNISSGKNVHEINRQLESVIANDSDLKDIVPETSTTCKIFKDLHIYTDPRISNLGMRVIVPVKSDISKQITEVFNIENNPKKEHSYRWLRYNLGVGEGVIDLPVDNSFPLEANCDYLHGISFHKGCYIGQELTARTHHTGVVRKRLMPLCFQKNIDMPTDNTIISNGVNLGKLRGVAGDVGLGLLRIEKALALKEISISDSTASTSKPFWWPIEAPKERISLQKA